jgi:Agenet domain
VCAKSISGKGKWFKGKVVSVNGDNYDIRYDDGDEESKVQPAAMRALDDATGVESKAVDSDRDRDTASFEAGDEVEARFGGRARWFKGVCVCALCEHCTDVLFAAHRCTGSAALRYMASSTYCLSSVLCMHKHCNA